MKQFIRFMSAALLAVVAAPGFAMGVEQLRSEWAHVRYEQPAATQLQSMAQLKTQADAAIAAAPEDAELLIWDGIITSSLAGLKGGLGALSLAREARTKLERAEKQRPGALNGSALTSLGALYYQVPGWPIGFGDKDKARRLLEASLKMDPDGMDCNYFYADFLFGEGDMAGARRAVEHGLAAAARPGREVADQGRRAELRSLLTRIDSRQRG
jgi:tetratricopeptide (TPR) repeat protein